MRIQATLALLLATAAPARAGDPPSKPAVLVGASQAARIAPTRGFIDDALAIDGARVAYVNTDGATFAELVIADVAGGEKLRTPLPPTLGTATAMRWLGDTLVVIGRTDDGASRAAVIDPTGKVLRTVGPAADITLVDRGGPRFALHRTKAGAAGATVHELELIDPATGKRVGKVRSFEITSAQTIKKSEFRVEHWRDGYTVLTGVKGGHWDPKENQRTPDVAATYDALTGKYSEQPMTDPMEHARRAQVLAQHPGEASFVRMSDDLMTIELWRAGAPAAVELDQPLAMYDASTVAYATDARGGQWLGLVIDPVNPAAVKRKKADIAYLDLFKIDGGKATRVARMLAAPKKKYRWGVVDGRWWVVERSLGFDRGGTSLTVLGLGG